MKITLHNLSPKPRKTVAIATINRTLGDKLPIECSFVADTGQVFRVVKCKSQGRKTVLRIFTYLDGNQKLTGELKTTPVKSDPYAWHQWTADDWMSLVPDIGVRVGTVINWTNTMLSFRLVESSPAHQRYWVKKRHDASGIIFEFYVDINAHDPVTPFWGKVVWSDRADPRPSRQFEEVLIRCGEYLSFDFATRYGIRPAAKVSDKWVTSLGTNIGFLDGSGLPLTGRMLTFVSVSNGPDLPNEELKDSLDAIQAAVDGPVLGLSHDWAGSWLAAGNVPRTSSQTNLVNASESSWNTFMDSLHVPNTWYATRELGIGKNPGATGDQEDFAATKGTFAVLLYEPKHIYRYQYSIYADMFRGFMFYENNGNPLRYQDHANWCTWNGVTHYHTGVSKDRLGKSTTIVDPVPITTFTGYDDEHRSQNNLCAYGMLTDDPLVIDMIAAIVNTDMASYRIKYPTMGEGAARAQGRTIGTWAQFSTLVEGQLLSDVTTLMNSRFTGLIRNPSFNTSKRVQVIGYHAPDYRKPIYDTSGNLLPTWSIWEHSLAVVGFYNAVKALSISATDRDNFTRLVKTVVEWGCFKEADKWYIINDMWYRDGEPITGDIVERNQFFTKTDNAGGVAGWTLAAILVATEFLPDTEPLKRKAQECATYFTGGREAVSLFEAEWWAAVRKVAN